MENRKELYNIEAEQAVLGTIILNNEYLYRVGEFLIAEHFYEPAHQKIFSQILYTIENANSIANIITLKQFFDADPYIKTVGGSKYLSILLGVASGIDISYYGQVIHDLAIKRNLVMLAEEVITNSYSPEEKISAIEQIEILENDLFKLSETGGNTSDFKKLSSSIRNTLDKTLLATKV